MQKKILRIVLVTVFVLIIPLVAMQFTDEVNWNLFDFVVMGGLLIVSGLTYELIARKLDNPNYRVIAGFVVLIVFLLIWAELAVGLFGTPWAGS